MNEPRSNRLCTLNLIFAVLIGIYVVYFAVGCSIQRSIIYPGQHRDVPEGILAANPDIVVMNVQSDGAKIEAWYLPPLDSTESIIAPYPTVVFTHGNNQLVDLCVGQVRALREMGLGVLLPEYPGYGRSSGKPTQVTITSAVVAAYDSTVAKGLMDSTRVLIAGHSLGGAVACALSLRRPSRAMILISTFVDMKSMVAKYFLPSFFALDPWDNLAAVRSYSFPLMIIHGERDQRIPYGHAVTLYENAVQRTLVTTQGDHNHPMPDWGDLWRSTRP
ncbi:MAG: alpha/beta fold hydrolase, partial [bacterium]